MPYQLMWYAEDVIYVEILKDFTEAELTEATRRIREEFLDSRAEATHMIVDVQNVVKYPTNLTTVLRASQVYMSHPHLGYIIFLGDHNALAKFIWGVVSRISNIQFENTDSLEGAQQILKATREKTAALKSKK